MNGTGYHKLFALCFLWCIALLTGCMSGQKLASTPTIYLSNNHYPDTNLPPALKTSKSDILFFTDRLNTPYKPGSPYYGYFRSDAVTFGKVQVEFGKNLSWNYLKTQSQTNSRSSKIPLSIKSIDDLVTYPDTPIPFSAHNGKIIPTYKYQHRYNQAKNKTRQYLVESIIKSGRQSVTLFIHGYNNSFDEAVFSLMNLWHFSGRYGVPVLYSWPAGNPGLLGYFRDREAGEFTIFHLKEVIRLIAKTRQVKHINIISHSRGTDIVTTALRELVIEERAKGINPRKSLKVDNLILAAPDLDFGIVSQRLIAEKFGPAINQITVYMNRGDNALSLSEFIMSGNRFGKLTAKNLSVNEQRIFAKIQNVNFIDVEGVNSFIGHGYFRSNPAVLSDIALLIRTDAKPGSSIRPLIHLKYNFWELPKAYPYSARTS